MPLIMISGLSSFLAPEIALAALIVPTVVSNIWQSFRNGTVAAVNAVAKHWVFILFLCFFVGVGSELASHLPRKSFFMILGCLVSGFACLQLLGITPTIQQHQKRRAEVMLGSLAGCFGGISGIWGPPTVAYLTALETHKSESTKVQGVIYGAGSLVLLTSHLKTGLLGGGTLVLSFSMILPALAGMAIGMQIQDRLNQDKFRRATLFVLILAGANLIRRGLLE